MIRYLTAFVLLAFIASCTAVQGPVHIKDNNIVQQQEKEEDEYDIEVLDPGFESWYQMKWSPAKDRSLSFYDSWNDRYVQAWNYKSSSPRYGSFFGDPINYDQSVDYGMEVSRKLYYYFKYVENELNIPILSMRAPSTGSF